MHDDAGVDVAGDFAGATSDHRENEDVNGDVPLAVSDGKKQAGDGGGEDEAEFDTEAAEHEAAENELFKERGDDTNEDKGGKEVGAVEGVGEADVLDLVPVDKREELASERHDEDGSNKIKEDAEEAEADFAPFGEGEAEFAASEEFFTDGGDDGIEDEKDSEEDEGLPSEAK